MKKILKKISSSKIIKILFWSIFWFGNLYVIKCYLQNGYLVSREILPPPPVFSLAIYFVLQFPIFMLNLTVVVFFLFFQSQPKKNWHYITILISSLVVIYFIHFFYQDLQYEIMKYLNTHH